MDLVLKIINFQLVFTTDCQPHPGQTFLGAPHSHKECQSYSYLSNLGTQATELTEAKESPYCHVRFSSHSDSGIT